MDEDKDWRLKGLRADGERLLNQAEKLFDKVSSAQRATAAAILHLAAETRAASLRAHPPTSDEDAC